MMGAGQGRPQGVRPAWKDSEGQKGAVLSAGSWAGSGSTVDIQATSEHRGARLALTWVGRLEVWTRAEAMQAALHKGGPGGNRGSRTGSGHPARGWLGWTVGV